VETNIRIQQAESLVNARLFGPDPLATLEEVVFAFEKDTGVQSAWVD